jgi:hypothetical protein
MHCTILPSAHSCAFVTDHAEPKLEEPTEQAQVKDLTNLAWIKVRLGAFNQCYLSFILNLVLCYS